jgi:antitoxin VapB
MNAIAKVFTTGRSQAVRIPKEFRFKEKELRISREGDRTILEPINKAPFDVDAWFAKLDQLGGRDFLPEGRSEQPPMPPDRKIFEE